MKWELIKKHYFWKKPEQSIEWITQNYKKQLRVTLNVNLFPFNKYWTHYKNEYYNVSEFRL